MNYSIFQAINSLAFRSSLLDRIMILFSTVVPTCFMIVLAAFYFYGIYKKDMKYRCIAVNTVAATAINLVLSYAIGLVFFVPRPFVNHKVNLLLPHVADASFPSDHSIGTMSIALGINNGFKLYGRIMIVLSCFVGLSRIFVGHHYPLDVLGGFAIALLMNKLYRLLLSNRVCKLYTFAEKRLCKLISFSK